MKIYKLIIILFSLSIVLQASDKSELPKPSTFFTTVSNDSMPNYFPLHIGNKWVYSYVNYSGVNDEILVDTVICIDTVRMDGELYYQLSSNFTDMFSVGNFIRYDLENGILYHKCNSDLVTYTMDCDESTDTLPNDFTYNSDFVDSTKMIRNGMVDYLDGIGPYGLPYSSYEYAPIIRSLLYAKVCKDGEYHEYYHKDCKPELELISIKPYNNSIYSLKIRVKATHPKSYYGFSPPAYIKVLDLNKEIMVYSRYVSNADTIAGANLHKQSPTNDELYFTLDIDKNLLDQGYSFEYKIIATDKIGVQTSLPDSGYATYDINDIEKIPNYFPLHIGNEWIYTSTTYNNPYVTNSVDTVVCKDTTTINGVHYFVLEGLDDIYPFLKKYVNYDSLAGELYLISKYGEQIIVPLPNNGAFGDPNDNYSIETVGARIFHGDSLQRKQWTDIFSFSAIFCEKVGLDGGHYEARGLKTYYSISSAKLYTDDSLYFYLGGPVSPIITHDTSDVTIVGNNVTLTYRLDHPLNQSDWYGTQILQNYNKELILQVTYISDSDTIAKTPIDIQIYNRYEVFSVSFILDIELLQAGYECYYSFTATDVNDVQTTIPEEGYFHLNTSIVSIEEDATLPIEYSLEQNYPNPFNPNTVITFSLPEAGKVLLSIYNVMGEKVMDLIDEEKSAGYYSKTFDASNLPSGVYIYKIVANSYADSKKMLLVK